MTQAFNLALHANFIDASGKVSASGIQPGAIPAAFPSGTIMLFVQTAAPTGWVKNTNHNNKALRVVSGTAGQGTSTDFVSSTLGGTSLSVAQMPSHNHAVSYATGSGFTGFGVTPSPDVSFQTALIQAAGSGASHNHSLTLSVNYVDTIICTKS